MPDLPPDVLIDILLRLPTKFLGQSKSVCKYWLSLISSEIFIKSHHHKAIFDTKTDHSRLLLASGHSFRSVNFALSSCYEGFDDDGTNAIVSLNNPFEKESVVSRLSGSCYGLIYFVCYNDFILLWNPTTHRTRLIRDLETSFSDGTRFYGLGYDLTIDDYKMVRASHSTYSKSISFEVLNLKNVSWRAVQVCHIDINIHDEIGIFSNGAVHWLVSHCDDPNKNDTILSFDMKEEIFIETALPNVTCAEYREFTYLGDLKGCLYAVFGGSDGVDMDVWVMKEYGVVNSWSKIFRLNWAEFDPDYGMCPLCFIHEDDVVILVIDLDACNIVRYNSSTKTTKILKKRSTDWHLSLSLEYTETLVSP